MAYMINYVNGYEVNYRKFSWVANISQSNKI